MAIETQPESAQAPGGGDPGATPRQRNFWLSPGIHTAVIGAVIGYLFGHWLGNFIAGQYPQYLGLSDDNDFAIVLGFSFLVIGWLIGLGVFDDLGRQMLGRPIRSWDDHSANVGFGRVLQVHPRPQGRRPAVPGRHADLLLHRRPAGDRDQDRAAVADVSRDEPHDLPRGGRRARDHDDDDDDLGHPRPVRQLPGADHDRLEAGRVPEDRGAVLLAHPLRLPDPAVELPAGRVPDRLDRLRAAVDPGRRGHGLVRGRVRPDGHLDHPGRVQHRGHDHLLPGAGHALVPAADVRLGDAHHRLPARAGGPGAGRRHVHDHHRPHGADRVLHRPARWQLVSVRGPVLVLRPSRGLHPGAAGVRHRLRAPAGLHQEAAVRLQDRCGGAVRRRDPVVLRLAAPPVRLAAWTPTCGRCSC